MSTESKAVTPSGDIGTPEADPELVCRPRNRGVIESIALQSGLAVAADEMWNRARRATLARDTVWLITLDFALAGLQRPARSRHPIERVPTERGRSHHVN